MSKRYGQTIVPGSRVEDALIEAGRPLTFDEVCAALPRRSTAGVSRALEAARKMGHVRRIGSLPHEVYEYLPPEQR